MQKAQLDWSRMLGFEQIADVRETAKIGTKTGQIKPPPGIGAKTGVIKPPPG